MFFPVRILAIVYIDLFRGVPLLLVLFIVGYGLPSLQLPVLSGLSIFVYGVIALTLVYSAYVAEVYRAGSSRSTRARRRPPVRSACPGRSPSAT